MNSMRKLPAPLEQLIRQVKTMIDESREAGDALEAASWGAQEGVLLSREEAEDLLSLIPEAKDITP